MGTYFGAHSYLVTAARVDAVNITGGTILSQGDGSNGGFEVSFQHDLGGCGNADSAIEVVIKDFIPWTKMGVRYELLGHSACWAFNEDGWSYALPSGGSGYILTYDEAYGDRVINTYLAQNDSPFDTHAKNVACDNDDNNFMRMNTTSWRICNFLRRRNGSSNLAGPAHGRSCNDTGAGNITVIKNIYVW